MARWPFQSVHSMSSRPTARSSSLQQLHHHISSSVLHKGWEDDIMSLPTRSLGRWGWAWAGHLCVGCWRWWWWRCCYGSFLGGALWRWYPRSVKIESRQWILFHVHKSCKAYGWLVKMHVLQVIKNINKNRNHHKIQRRSGWFREKNYKNQKLTNSKHYHKLKPEENYEVIENIFSLNSTRKTFVPMYSEGKGQQTFIPIKQYDLKVWENQVTHNQWGVGDLWKPTCMSKKGR